MPDLDFYYCTQKGTLSLASVEGGELHTKPLSLNYQTEDLGPIDEILDLTENGLLLLLHSGKSAITFRGKVHYLLGSYRSFFWCRHGSINRVCFTHQ